MFILNRQKCGDVRGLCLPNIQITFDSSNLANGVAHPPQLDLSADPTPETGRVYRIVGLLVAIADSTTAHPNSPFKPKPDRRSNDESHQPNANPQNLQTERETPNPLCAPREGSPTKGSPTKCLTSCLLTIAFSI